MGSKYKSYNKVNRLNHHNPYPIAMSNAFQFHFKNLIHADLKLLQPAPPAPAPGTLYPSTLPDFLAPPSSQGVA